MLISVLTPFHSARPDSDAARQQLAGYLGALARQPGPLELILAAAIAGRPGPWQAILRELAGPNYPHALRCLAFPYRPLGTSPASRGATLNAAAAMAQGELLLVLHADNRLPDGALQTVRQAARAGFRAGAFPKRYAPRTPLLALQEWWLNAWQLGVRRRTVGTNAVWLARELWQPLPEARLFEDFALSEQLARLPLFRASAPVRVDAGKYLQTGVAASIAINAAVIGLHRVFGVSPDRLADALYSRRGLAAGTAGFWPRFARRVVHLIRDR